MRIGMQTQVAGGAARTSRQAMLLKQIRRLEKERRKLQKELSEAAGVPDGFDAARQAQATPMAIGQPVAAVEGQAGDVPGGASGAAAPGVSAGSGSAAAAAIGNAAVAKAMPAALDASGMAGGSSETSAYKRPPEQIMKLIQLVTMQIMTLQEQLGQDATQVMTVSMDDEDDDGSASPGMPQPVLPQAEEPAPPASVSPAAAVADGHVDGYA